MSAQQVTSKYWRDFARLQVHSDLLRQYAIEVSAYIVPAETLADYFDAESASLWGKPIYFSDEGKWGVVSEVTP